MPTATSPQETFRSDYQPVPFGFESVAMEFQLFADHALVKTTLQVRRSQVGSEDLVLHGEELNTLSIAVDGRILGEEEYTLNAESLRVPGLPEACELETQVRIEPQNNLQLSGLYQSSGNFCTQCEAEGFRRITWFLDRPDVMCTFKVRVEGELATCPVLLSNGNKTAEGHLDDGRHFAVWEDPWPKPSYLFALVAGDLGHIKDSFTTCSGREVALWIWSEKENVDQLDHAMKCLKSSMRWDEEHYGREYDLDIYNIVAVNDFNMGAMENKSLNVFNTAYVLASPETATDADYEGVDGVIAHEYFHNWTGNRVTCRDWFQLTLKEGLTVFRDQTYSADQTSEAVKRVEDVKILRAIQFPEDAGPMSHPIRPESYVAMDNFYTSTVYNKGAEVIRMYRTLLGADGFRKGTDLYFDRHDGQAVTCDDFRAAMADANERDLTQFERWYAQAGTPEVRAEVEWDAESGSVTIALEQSCPATPGQFEKEPFHIPIAWGLLGADGQDLVGTEVFELTEKRQEITVKGLPERPVPSLLRGFSAPIKLLFDESDENLGFRLAHDPDPFNRWEAGQKLGARVVLGAEEKMCAGEDVETPTALMDAFRSTLERTDLDPSLQAYALRLPDEATLAEEMGMVRPDSLHAARQQVVRILAKEHQELLLQTYERLAPSGPFVHNLAEAGRRRLRNLCLSYLSSLEDPSSIALCQQQFSNADNMTDQFAALACLSATPGQEAEQALDQFFETWKSKALVVDKWLAVQAASPRLDTLENVTALLGHEAFDIRNPNKARALIRPFFRNLVHFHRSDGAGYQWVADRVLELCPLNPQIAARMAGAFSSWKSYDSERQALIRQELERIETSNPPKDVLEIIQRTLKA